VSTKQYSSYDFQGLPILNFTLEVLGSDPAAPAAGARPYYHSGETQAKVILAGGAVQKLGVANIVNADVAAGAAIAESKLSLASDAAAGTASRRTIGTGALQAMAGNTRLDQVTAPTAAVSLNSQRITNLSDPSTGTDAANQQYVLAQIELRASGQDWKDAVRAATTANITLSAPQTIDGVSVIAGDRVLVKNQTTASQNGIYVVAAGAWTRATDADSSAEVTSGMTVAVAEGTTLQNTIWLLTTDNPITLATTALAFTQIGAGGTTYTASTGLTMVGNDVRLVIPVAIASGGTNATDIATARTNLNVPQRGFASDIGALTAGVEATIAHGLGTADVNVSVRDKTSGYIVGIDAGADATNVKITSAIAVAGAVLRVVANPIS
jgi:hypothetical protein